MSIDIKKDTIRDVIANGDSKHYFGKVLTVEDPYKLSESDVELYYNKYVHILKEEFSGAMAYTFVDGIGELGAYFFNIENKKELKEDLAKDKFLSKAIGSVCYGLWNRFGYGIAPVTVAAIITKHYCKNRKTDEDEEDKMAEVQKQIENALELDEVDTNI